MGRAGVAAAVAKRVDAGKTLALGPMGHGLAQAAVQMVFLILVLY